MYLGHFVLSGHSCVRTLQLIRVWSFSVSTVNRSGIVYVCMYTLFPVPLDAVKRLLTDRGMGRHALPQSDKVLRLAEEYFTPLCLIHWVLF